MTKLKGLITIDGPDATGKSTLANKIAELLEGEVIHMTWTPELAKVMNMYRGHGIGYAAALAHDRVVVLERPWMCHPIYSTVYREGNYKISAVEHWAQQTEAHAKINILALPRDIDTWINNYRRMCDAREELHGKDQNKMMEVHEHFQSFAVNDFEYLVPGMKRLKNVEFYDYLTHGRRVEDFILHRVVPTL